MKGSEGDGEKVLGGGVGAVETLGGGGRKEERMRKWEEQEKAGAAEDDFDIGEGGVVRA